MEFEAWKAALINEIETAAEGRAEQALWHRDEGETVQTMLAFTPAAAGASVQT